MSVLVDMADAVLAVLQGASLSVAIAPERGYLVVRDLSSLDGIKVTVIPGAEEIAAFDLTPRHEYLPEVMIWVQRRVNPTNEECDPLMNLVEEIAGQFLPGKRLPGTQATIQHLKHEPPYDPDRLDAQRTFTSGLTLTMKFTR